MDISESARRHGVDDEDIVHAWESAIRYVEYEYRGDERLLVIGADRHGRMLELWPSRGIKRCLAVISRWVDRDREVARQVRGGPSDGAHVVVAGTRTTGWVGWRIGRSGRGRARIRCPPVVEARIVECGGTHPGWGPRTIVSR